MIRVARLITRLNIGGPSLQVFLLHRHLQRYGFTTEVYCGELDPGEEEMTFHESARGIEPNRLKGLGRDIDLVRDLPLIVRLWRIFKRTKPRVVHTHQAKAGAVGRLAARLAGVPVIVHTYHGNVFRGHFGPVKKKIFVGLERLLALITTKIVVISELQKKDITEVFKIAPTGKVQIIPLGFDLSRFDGVDRFKGRLRKRLGLDEHKLLVGIVARFEPVKNHRLFIEVARIVREKREDVHFVVIGDGKLRPDIERWISNGNLDSDVTLAGNLTEIEEALADLDVVALTSLSEGTPVSLIEAMAAGRPVISTRVGGVPDLIDDGVTGVLVDLNDSATTEAFAFKLLALLDDAALRERLASAARVKVRSIYTIDRLARDVAGLYGRCLAGN